MPVIRISDATYARMQRHAKPFEDTPESIIAKALDALDMINDEPAASPQVEPRKRSDAPKLPQKEFRLPLLMTLLKAGGSAPAKDVRATIEPLISYRLREGDYESVSTGDPRWWNAVCWTRNELVKEGLMRGDSERGTWEVSDAGKALPATLHRMENGTDRLIAKGALEKMAEEFWRRRSANEASLIMVGDESFKQVGPFPAACFQTIDELEFSIRTFNSLRDQGMVYVGDLVNARETDLLRAVDFGRKNLNELKEILAQKGLQIEMDVQGWPPEDIERRSARQE